MPQGARGLVKFGENFLKQVIADMADYRFGTLSH